MGPWPSSRGPKNLCRLAMRGPDNITVLAETDAGIVGFVHLVPDDDERWGPLVDNLHVTHAHRRHGIGSALITRAAQAVIDGGTTGSMYLWVLEQNRRRSPFTRRTAAGPPSEHSRNRRAACQAASMATR
ncbi:MAG: GNAT family N-acetyltransferase [Hyphomicrobiales bacterium]